MIGWMNCMALIPETNYLFDTTFFIDAYKNRGDVISVLSQAQSLEIACCYSILTEVELWAYGGMDSEMEQEHKILLKPFQRYFVNVTIARRAGRLRRLLVQNVGKDAAPGISDCIIAATAEYHNLTLYSRNHRHFRLFPQYGIPFYEYTI